MIHVDGPSILGTPGKKSSKWVHCMRDVQPQKFVNVDGQTYIIGTQDRPLEDVHWKAHQNRKWWEVR